MELLRSQARGGPRLIRREVDGAAYEVTGVAHLHELLRLPLSEIVRLCRDPGAPFEDPIAPLPIPDGRMEIWAAGVTYQRSKAARAEESANASVYEAVYDALRPELFFKASAWRVATTGDPIGIRTDSPLNVPEPELALVVNKFAEVIGFTVCNDMSSRSIEGENPLYLPQAKIYDRSCAIAPTIRPVWEISDPYALDVRMTIERGGTQAWQGSSSTSQLHRRFDELVAYLFRSQSFPDGVILSTGTSLVPGLSFTLLPGDIVTVEIPEVATLRNHVISV